MSAKYLMSFWTQGMSEELRSRRIAVNSIWPVTAIDTAAVRNILPWALKNSRKPQIMADASYYIITQPADVYTGQCLLDEDVLLSAGVTDFSVYDTDVSD